MPQTITVSQAATALHKGRIVAYPTEAIYGLGCDPWNPKAVSQLLDLKRRSIERGFILVASTFKQVADLIADIPQEKIDMALATWPGSITWAFPAKSHVPVCLRGNHDTIALRVSAHPVVRDLCESFGGPIISTSANIADHPPSRSAQECYLHFHQSLQDIVTGTLGDANTPTEIRDVMSGDILRQA